MSLLILVQKSASLFLSSLGNIISCSWASLRLFAFETKGYGGSLQKSAGAGRTVLWASIASLTCLSSVAENLPFL